MKNVPKLQFKKFVDVRRLDKVDFEIYVQLKWSSKLFPPLQLGLLVQLQ